MVLSYSLIFPFVKISYKDINQLNWPDHVKNKTRELELSER